MHLNEDMICMKHNEYLKTLSTKLKCEKSNERRYLLIKFFKLFCEIEQLSQLLFITRDI